MPLDISQIRAQFPALQREAIFLDNPAGTQVAQQVLNRMNQYMVEMNANVHGAFATSRESDILLDEARVRRGRFPGCFPTRRSRFWSQYDLTDFQSQPLIGALA